MKNCFKDWSQPNNGLTLIILVDFVILMDTISMYLPMGPHVEFLIFYVFVPEDCFYRALAEALMKYLHYAIFHLGFHCLPK